MNTKPMADLVPYDRFTVQGESASFLAWNGRTDIVYGMTYRQAVVIDANNKTTAWWVGMGQHVSIG